MSLLWLCKASKLKYPLHTTLQAKKIVQAEVVICSTKMNANAADVSLKYKKNAGTVAQFSFQTTAQYHCFSQ